MKRVDHSEAVLFARNGRVIRRSANQGRAGSILSSSSASSSSSFSSLKPLLEKRRGRGRTTGRPRPPEEDISADYLREEWQAMRDAQRELEVSRQRYADLYDLAPVGYLSLTRSGGIREINLAGAKMLGMARSRLAGGHLLTFIKPSHRRKYLNHLTRLRRGQRHV